MNLSISRVRGRIWLISIKIDSIRFQLNFQKRSHDIRSTKWRAALESVFRKIRRLNISILTIIYNVLLCYILSPDRIESNGMEQQQQHQQQRKSSRNLLGNLLIKVHYYVRIFRKACFTAPIRQVIINTASILIIPQSESTTLLFPTD